MTDYTNRHTVDDNNDRVEVQSAINNKYQIVSEKLCPQIHSTTPNHM